MGKVRVFLSWSGDRSRHVAQALNEWLPDVIQNTVPFFSPDMYAGQRWFETIGKELESSDFAILCITRENAKSPWVNFEAGACAKRIAVAQVVPYLIDGEPTDYEPPLSMFQGAKADEQGTLGLLKSINAAQGEDHFDDAKLHRLYNPLWPRLKSAFDALPTGESIKSPARSPDEMFIEILGQIRDLASTMTGLQGSFDLIGPVWSKLTSGDINPGIERLAARQFLHGLIMKTASMQQSVEECLAVTTDLQSTEGLKAERDHLRRQFEFLVKSDPEQGVSTTIPPPPSTGATELDVYLERIPRPNVQ